METQFDQLAEAYERSFTELPFRRHIELPSVLAALGAPDGIAGQRALDLGCGSGYYTRLLADLGAEPVVGLDQSAGMVGYAREREAREPRGVRYLVQHAGDGSAGVADPTLSGSCDLVLAVYVLPYATTSEILHQMCLTARTALVPGGRFVTAVLNPDFATEPGYYRPFGFDLVAGPATANEGGSFLLRTHIGEHAMEVTAHRWSRSAHEAALTRAGFTTFAWQAPHCDPGSDPAPSGRYLAVPHFLLLTAS
ncbi:class I SAM-dependent methyltransferase [Amycolatopsis sp. PS_44_ISF1]|uniref:class I SAM-dependent methyltransferase n=1 Tax=Amycolatopsis sp. PS_44_ISF1 TaxID=2974917 RepID=UPI0028DE43A3|nr:class I SAM-dependent methyltransferase [Amycolatopsis sp. PS_44_ISF1]MDT8914503.1 class I SAM-dependent methyltransferase [Amycolatopsis sp. PS_44_ISF1]